MPLLGVSHKGWWRKASAGIQHKNSLTTGTIPYKYRYDMVSAMLSRFTDSRGLQMSWARSVNEAKKSLGFQFDGRLHWPHVMMFYNIGCRWIESELKIKTACILRGWRGRLLRSWACCSAMTGLISRCSRSRKMRNGVVVFVKKSEKIKMTRFWNYWNSK